ncbi:MULTISPECIES: fumarylacetoacetase [unclassified Modestobacter]|uniref:fumarylacetoacetase n=1 Tax=unclassified Modestobacter TaxID=2643866 RepID=UPI0022AA09F8|nr:MULTISPECIES: fumarylacetoacetase [unclassified Modestobacter]MCZ2826857.1 fumarylacetoacetase [Modestobacter sp. VKM Ac-2981]MCZ2855447.1 fumarylacetoacetase [Modestobacter sp. VKM Ac-2982]
MTDSWLDLPADTGYGLANLPHGVFSTAGTAPRTGVAIGDQVLDLAAATGDDVHATGTLNAFLAQGPAAWAALRAQLVDWFTDSAHRGAVEPHLLPRADVTMHLPIEVADYVDFYSSQHHAENLGKMFRPDSAALTPNWKHLPIGYHGRAGTVAVSGTPVVRPCGQRKAPADDAPTFGPSQRLDIEAEVGFVVGAGSELGTAVPVGRFADHVFGVCLVNDWSSRDLQAWEYVPLGPFLGKSFLTSVSPWVVPLAALASARVDPPARDPQPLPYLRDDGERWGLDISLEVRLNGEVLSRPPFDLMYWTPAQQLAHMTVNGASLRTGDLFASGTVSGPRADQRGSFIELSWGGKEPLTLADGSTRTFLEDGDEVVITATAPGPDGTRIAFGEVTGRVEPAR